MSQIFWIVAGKVWAKCAGNLAYLMIDRAILYQPGVMFATGVGQAHAC